MSIPNVLSIFRLLLSGVFVVVFFSDNPNALTYSALIYLLAGITDVLDGIIARKFNMITKLGKILDPAADKIMTFCVFICIAIKGIIPAWAVIILFCKELVLAVGGLTMYKKINNVFSANLLGKAATVSFVVSGIVLMLFNNNLPDYLKYTLITISLVLTISSLGSYMYKLIKLWGSKE